MLTVYSIPIWGTPMYKWHCKTVVSTYYYAGRIPKEAFYIDALSPECRVFKTQKWFLVLRELRLGNQGHENLKRVSPSLNIIDKQSCITANCARNLCYISRNIPRKVNNIYLLNLVTLLPTKQNKAKIHSMENPTAKKGVQWNHYVFLMIVK